MKSISDMSVGLSRSDFFVVRKIFITGSIQDLIGFLAIYFCACRI